MLAVNATRQDWEALRMRVEKKAEENRTGFEKANDPELWVRFVEEKNQAEKMARENDQAIRLANSRERAAAGKPEEETGGMKDEEYVKSFGAGMFLAGAIVGAAILYLVSYFL